MTNEKKESILKLKSYHIIILGCLLSSLLIINSNYVNDQRAKEKLYKEKSQLFDQIIMKRYLQEQEQPKDSTDEICKRGTQDLIDYYKTGNLETIDLKDEKIKCEDKDKDYINALINLIKKFAGGQGEGDDNEENPEENPEGTPVDPPHDGRRNLEGESMSIDEMQDDLMSYGMHILPILAFLVIAILCIPGYLICCFCCCCNCCCCCCCKKPGCKVPCFIFTYVFYALVVAVCFYGLTQSNSIYAGLADTECSILKFFDQILDGETKQELPRWAGINGIDGILEDLYNNINDMKGDTNTKLTNKLDNITHVEGLFLTHMQGTGDKFFSGSTYKTDYSVDYEGGFVIQYTGGSIEVSGKYVLDIVKMFGKYNADTQKYLPENSCLDLWEKEFKIVSSTANTYMNKAKTGFNQILDGNVDKMLQNLKDGRTQLDGIKTSFEGIKTDISNILVEYSGLIDEYGKLGFKLVFGVLALINIAIAAFMLLICMCSGKKCTNCCCCRCICKLFTHLLWNILAILMIIVFLVGSLIALIGQVGSDFMSIISFVVSDDNTDKILLDQLGDSRPYLERCITGDGNIAEQLGLSTGQINSFDDIKKAEQTIEETKTTFNEKKQYVTYTLYKDNLLGRANLTNNELCLVPEDADINPTDPNTFSNALSFTAILTIMNEYTLSKSNEKWVKNSLDTPQLCPKNSGDSIDHEPTDNNIDINLLQCYPSYRDWIKTLESKDSPSEEEKNIKNTAKIITNTLEFLENAKKDSDGYYMKILNDLKGEYVKYLDAYIDALDFFNSTIKKVTGKLNEYANDNETFSFIKCNFVGTNLKIILKYLKSALGKDIYTVGLCFLIVGCSLMLSISSTILLIVIINTDIDKNKKDLKKSENMSNYMLNSEGRVIRYSE
jgi:hypothetical protein